MTGIIVTEEYAPAPHTCMKVAPQIVTVTENMRNIRSRSPSRHAKRSKRERHDSGSDDESERRRKKRKDKKRKEGKGRHADEKRSVLTGKKIKLKVHMDKEDHERDANRRDLLQFLNSAFE
ncbi:hypothetical protein ONZ45_g2572 [Pleurotus djamor]|nr:hypothetical protein ONZ45_g2572 [Pleurotus djamor]